jgi:hypothetical protein
MAVWSNPTESLIRAYTGAARRDMNRRVYGHGLGLENTAMQDNCLTRDRYHVTFLSIRFMIMK